MPAFPTYSFAFLTQYFALYSSCLRLRIWPCYECLYFFFKIMFGARKLIHLNTITCLRFSMVWGPLRRPLRKWPQWDCWGVGLTMEWVAWVTEVRFLVWSISGHREQSAPTPFGLRHLIGLTEHLWASPKCKDVDYNHNQTWIHNQLLTLVQHK